MTNTNTLTKSHSNASNADLVGLYLKEIGRLPLLTSEQEINYGRSVQQMISLYSSKQILTVNNGREPTLREWAEFVGELSEQKLTNLIRQGEQAKKKMIEGNLRLVVLIAKKYQHRGVELIDLIQEGSLGLQRAVEKFDPTLGYKFSTYAYWWIKQGIKRSLTNQSRTIRLPVHLHERLSKIKRQEYDLTQKLGRSPQIAEISQELGFNENQVRECLEVSRSLISLSLLCGSEKDGELLTLIPASQLSPLDLTGVELSRQEVLELVRQLNAREQEIISLSFGLDGDKALTLKEIATKLNLSRERIRQVQITALRKLRKITKSCDSWDIEVLSQQDS